MANKLQAPMEEWAETKALLSNSWSWSCSLKRLQVPDNSINDAKGLENYARPPLLQLNFPIP